MKTILLKLAGPMQSYGTNSSFETRHTDYYPSKSAILGLLAAASGCRRDKPDTDLALQRWNELQFAVRVDQKGQLLCDYHTAHKYKPDGEPERTYVTRRYYLEDYVFIVALSHPDAAVIGELETALRAPCFQPFMGKRSLPVPADFLLGVTDGGVWESLRAYPWQAKAWYVRRLYRYAAEVSVDVYADAAILPQSRKHMRRDRVITFAQTGRKFTYRYEAQAHVTLSNPYYQRPTSAEHDAFAGIGG